MTIAVLTTKPIRLARQYRAWGERHFRAYLALFIDEPERAEWHRKCADECYAMAERKWSEEEEARFGAMQEIYR